MLLKAHRRGPGPRSHLPYWQNEGRPSISVFSSPVSSSKSILVLYVVKSEGRSVRVCDAFSEVSHGALIVLRGLY